MIEKICEICNNKFYLQKFNTNKVCSQICRKEKILITRKKYYIKNKERMKMNSFQRYLKFKNDNDFINNSSMRSKKHYLKMKDNCEFINKRKEHHKNWVNKNKEYLKIYNINWKKTNNDYYKKYMNDWIKNNKSYIDLYKKNYYEKNMEKINKMRYIYQTKMYKTNMFFKLRHNLNISLRQAIKNNYKHGKTLELLGCNINELKLYIENKFKLGMTWENYGMYGWHVDHIIPISMFDLTNINEQKICFHYSNLQPLWAKENLSKGNKLYNKYNEIIRYQMGSEIANDKL